MIDTNPDDFRVVFVQSSRGHMRALPKKEINFFRILDYPLSFVMC